MEHGDHFFLRKKKARGPYLDVVLGEIRDRAWDGWPNGGARSPLRQVS